MIIPRDKYLQELRSVMHNGMIKIITGVRRCGKSYLLFVGRLDCVNYIFLAEGINGKREGEGYSHHRLYPSKSFLY